MDKMDRDILRMIQADNRLSSAEVGQAIGLSVSAVNERIRRLNSTGIVRGNHAVLHPEQVDATLCAFIFVDLIPKPDEAGFRARVGSRPEIQEVHQVAGAHCYVLKVRLSGTHALQALLSNHIKTIPGVLRTETVIVLETVTETPEIALDTPATECAAECDQQ